MSLLCIIMNIRLSDEPIFQISKIRIENLREMKNPMDTFWLSINLVNYLQILVIGKKIKEKLKIQLTK